MTTAIIKHIDLSTIEDGVKPWVKVDGPGQSFTLHDVEHSVSNIREHGADFTTENTGFQLLKRPAKEKAFQDDQAIRTSYYNEVESLLRDTLPGKINKVHIFDHTIRKREKTSSRQPVQQLHVDQTAEAVRTRVRRHLPDEAEELLKHRVALINVWKPIAHPARDFPLAVVDWRSTERKDFVAVDLLYPRRVDSVTGDDDDDRGKEVLPDETKLQSTEGYIVKGETMSVSHSPSHRFWYAKDMTPDEWLLLKCYDSRGDGEPEGRQGLALRVPHTAFQDPNTPVDAPGRQSIEVRCLVFYEE